MLIFSVFPGNDFDDDDFPLFRRFFPGGINSVRGYEARTLGPKDENGSEYGGSKQLVNNFEIIFPIISSAGLKGVVFYDIGEAFDDDESIWEAPELENKKTNHKIFKISFKFIYSNKL